MHVKARTMAFGGLLLALSVVCMALGSVIETNTLFLLAAASYFVGIVIRELGLRTGTAFYVAAVLLGFIITPNKFYVISFAGMGFYILVIEAAWRGMSGKRSLQKKSIFWIIKYALFNVMYLPMLLFFQELLFPGKTLSGGLFVVVVIAGQIGLWIYDRAYEYVQAHIWNKMRGKVLKM
nr:hypothetical protein [uncultured Sellimonas sp.]